MAINFSIDNDRSLGAPGIQDVTLDQSSQAQTPGTTDHGNDVDLSLTGGNIDGFGPNPGLDAGFETYLSTLGLSPAQLNFAAGNAATGSADAEGASSSSNFIQVSASNGETISDLFFNVLDNPTTHNQVVGMQTLDNLNVYLHVDASGNFATLTTASGAGGRVVAAFGLYAETIAGDQHSASAGVQMVTFEAIRHPVNPNPDDTLSVTDVLQIGASASISFNFDNLPSGSFLYAAVGSQSAALLVTGQDLNVNDTANKLGDIVTGGPSDPSDTVNTSQGGIGATIGINSQHFTDTSVPGGKVDGAVGVFTLVKGFGSFDATVNGTSEGTGTNVKEITYSDYVNAPSAKIFISQSTGGAALGGGIRVSLWEAGGGGSADHLTSALKPEQGYADVAGGSQSYIGDQDTDSHLRDDTPVVAGMVTVKRGSTTYSWTSATSGTAQGGITVTIDAAHPNTFTITGLTTSDTIGFFANDDPANPLDGTFNRFDVQALANTNPVDIGRIDLAQGVQVGAGLGSHLFIDDDGPTIAPTINANATINIDESGPTATSTITFAGIAKGVDPDVTPGGGAIARGVSGGAVIDPHAVFGTDGPAASSSLTYALSLSASSVPSGLTLTDGSAINLQNVGGTIVGVVSGGAFNGKAAFGIAIDSSTGIVTLEQYLSLHHNSADSNGDSDEYVQMALGSVSVTATATDGDSDSKTSSGVDISQLLFFHDDGPAVAPTINPNATIDIDESGPTATSTIVTGAVVKGVDPDVTAGGGAIARGVSGSAVVDPHAAFGADGASASGSISYALSLSALSVVSGVTLTDGSTINLQNVGGAIVGVVSGGAFDGKAAFAIAINSSTGVVTLEQYLSLHHNSADSNGDLNEYVQMALGSVGVTVTATDGDTDSKTSSAVDISQLLFFHDDGPAVAPTINPNATIDIDESGPTATSTIVTGAVVKGVDPDVTAGGGAIARGVSGSAVVDPHAAFGADGAATSGSVSYALSLSALSVVSGVTLTDGSAINLQNVGGAIVGVVSGGAFDGKAAFAIAINSSTGVVTLEQYLSLHHNSADSNGDSNEYVQMALGSVGVTVTATDGDSDSKTSSAVDISQLLFFHDDGPSITPNATGAPSITDSDNDLVTNNHANYANNFNSTYGADGSAGTPVTYGLSTTVGANSGLIESGTGLQVFLFKVGDTVVGKSGTNSTTAATGTTVFVVSIDGTGEVTLDQQRAVVHDQTLSQGTSTTLLSAGLVAVNATAHDKDGDTASTHIDIGQLLNFTDDTPTITAQIQNGEVQFKVDPVLGTVTHSLNGAVHADGTSATQTSMTGTAEYTISYWDTPTNVYPNLNAQLTGNGTVLTYYSDAADTNAVYRLTLDPVAFSGSGGYKFEVLQPPPNLSTNFGFTDLPSGQNLDGTIATDKADLTKGGLLVFPSNPVLNADGTFTNTSGTINTSKGGGPVTIGNGNQAFDSSQEGAYFMYVDNPSAASVGGLGLTQTSADDADTIRFNGLNQSTDSSVSIVQASGLGTAKKPGPVIHIFSFEAAASTAVTTDAAARSLVNNPVVATGAAEVSITDVKIHDSTGKVVEWGHFNGTMTVLQDVTGDNQVTAADNVGSVISFINDNPGGTAVYSATVSQLKAGYTIEFLTASNHNIALVQNVSGSFDIGGFSASTQTTVPAQNFHFAATITDYDNDSYGGHLATFADWSVTVDSVTFP